MLNLIKHTELRVKVVKGTPSSVFHILAVPSVDVEAKNSESRLVYDKQKRLRNSESRPNISPTPLKQISQQLERIKKTFVHRHQIINLYQYMNSASSIGLLTMSILPLK